MLRLLSWASRKRDPLGRLSLRVKSAIKLLAGFYLLLNLCVSTVPRCDSILELLQRTLLSDQEATLASQHAARSMSCHDTQPVSGGSRINDDRICECSLVKFFSATLPQFNPEQFIGFKIQTVTLLSFAIPLWNPATIKGPEPPYPRLPLA
jgi:hypothetical protein